MDFYDRIEYAARPPTPPTLGELTEYLDKKAPELRLKYEYNSGEHTITIYRTSSGEEQLVYRRWNIPPLGTDDLAQDLARWIRDNIGRR